MSVDNAISLLKETSNLYQGEYFYKSVYDNNEIALSPSFFHNLKPLVC